MKTICSINSIIYLSVHHVWHYDSLQHRIDVRNKALTSEIWRETGRNMHVN